MVPAEILVIPQLPLLPNGKIDRQALIAGRRAPPTRQRPSRQRAAGRQGRGAVGGSWQQFFGRQTVTTTSSFACLGGDSLSYVSAYLSVEEALGCPDGGPP